MLVSAKYGFVILLTPKCASNSIESMLGPYIDFSLSGPPQFRHTNYRQFERFIKPYLQETCGETSFETICLLREPTSWLYSWYRFRARAALRSADGGPAENSTSGILFPEFVEAYVSPNPPSYANTGDTQFDFVRNERGEVGVDKIVPYEHIDRLVQYMSDKVGARLSLPTKNVSPQTVYSSGVLQKASDLIQKTLIRFKVDARKKDTSPDKLDIPTELRAALRQKLENDFNTYEAALKAVASNAQSLDGDKV